MKPFLLDGQKFGRWTVLNRAPDRGDYIVRWACVCGCGAVREVASAALRKGQSVQCRSCAQIARVSMIEARRERHIWYGMKSRCERPADPKYPRYGARGIRVCDRWQDFRAFYSDVGPRPSPRHTLDRMNNDGDYEPSNVRWALPVEQSNNRSTSRHITINGCKQTLAQWCRECGIRVSLAHARLQRGWPAERALTEPPHQCGGDMRRRAA